MKKLLSWCKENWLLTATLFLLAFIPLYPKLPLINVIRTWVYIRLEDFFVALLIGVYILTKAAKRHVHGSALTWPILVYWGIGLLSVVVSLLFIGPKLAGYFPHLVVLHYIRRIEYIMLFFIAFDAVAKREGALKWVIAVVGFTVLGIFIYGIGQKFLGFPAYLTMNEEFAKGIPLRLPPTARIASTFGGHYDLAAYLVLVIPILGSLVFSLRRLWQKGIFFLLAVAALILLLLTASRVSFGVYLVAISVMLLWQKKPILILPVIIASFIMLNSVSSASERFYKTFRYTDVIVDLSTGKPIGTLESLEGGTARIEEIESPAEEELPKGSGFIGVGDQSGLALKTIEVYKSKDLATGAGELTTVTGSFLIQKAFVYDISITTRFQGQWPKAIEAFKRNILLGSGFSTLSVAADGDYHRMLGETGLLGTIAFLGIILVAFLLFLKGKDSMRGPPRGFVIGVFAGLTGLLLNAVLIDVFEASKVAFTLWVLLGVAVALLMQKTKWTKPYFSVLWHVFTHKYAYMAYLVSGVFLLYGSIVSMYFVGDDFTWLKWAAQSSVWDVGNYFVQAGGFFYRPIPKLWYFLLFSVFWLKPAAYHFFSLVLLSVVVLSVYRLLISQNVRWYLAWGVSLLFAVLSVHHENVFWISSHSSLLASAMLSVSLVIFQSIWKRHSRLNPLAYSLALLMLLGSMLSYDGMVVAPILVALIGTVVYRKRVSALAPLLLVPLYAWMRQSSGALTAQGDYAYKASTFLTNSIANGIGYAFAILIGPKAIEYFEGLRSVMRAYKGVLGIAAGAVFGIVFLSLALLRKQLIAQKDIVVWFFCAVVALASYLPLGGMAERYVFIASVFFVIGIGVAVERLWRTGASKILVAVFIVVSIVWNVRETKRVSGDWAKASSITEKTLLAIRKSYFPLQGPTTFVFVNVPIRYGRAWIFPVGLPDALWHMFRNQTSVILSPNVEEAFAIKGKKPGTWEILSFENYTIKKIEKETQVVPVQ